MSSPSSEAPAAAGESMAAVVETETSLSPAEGPAAEVEQPTTANKNVAGDELVDEKEEEKKPTAFDPESVDQSEHSPAGTADEFAGTSQAESADKSATEIPNSAAAAKRLPSPAGGRARDQRDRSPHSDGRANDDASCRLSAGEFPLFDPTSRLTEYEELFKNRYTDDDSEYVKSAALETMEPVMIEPWPPFGSGGNRYGGGGGRGGQQPRDGRYQQRWQNPNSNYRQNQYGNNQRSNGNGGYGGQRQGRGGGRGGYGSHYDNGQGGGGGGGYGSHYSQGGGGGGGYGSHYSQGGGGGGGYGSHYSHGGGR